MADQQEQNDQRPGGATIGDRLTEDEARQLLNRAPKDDEDEHGAKDRRREQGDNEDDPDDGDELLGDAGRRALERERKDRKRAAERAARAEKRMEELEAKVREYETAGQSETERLQGDRDTYKGKFESTFAELRRVKIAMSTAPEHATLAQMAKVAKRLAGDTDEALTDDAAELWEDYAPAPPRTPASKPKEQLRSGLRGGGEPDEDDEPLDPKKLAALIPRAR